MTETTGPRHRRPVGADAPHADTEAADDDGELIEVPIELDRLGRPAKWTPVADRRAAIDWDARAWRPL